jgi:5-methylcytosine-specific restriction endonuclease McrA
VPDRNGKKKIRSQCKVCLNLKSKNRYYANHEESLRKVRARIKKRWPQYLEYVRLWKAANPERRLKDDESYRQRRRQREADQSDGTLTVPAMRKLFGMAKACPMCGDSFSKDKPKSLDHVVPLAKGGPHSLSNVSVVCRPCNIAKSDKELFLI